MLTEPGDTVFHAFFFINRNEILVKNMEAINVHGDGNCLFRRLNKIYFNKEDYYLFFRQYIFDYILKNLKTDFKYKMNIIDDSTFNNLILDYFCSLKNPLKICF